MDSPRKESRARRFFRGHRAITVYGITVLALFVLSAAVELIARYNVAFAEFWSRYPGGAIRFVLAKLTTLIPFSLAEVLLLLVPLAALAAIILVISGVRGYSRTDPRSVLIASVSAPLIICTIFCFGFGPCYYRKTLSENIGLDENPVDAESLYETAVWLAECIDTTGITFAIGGESRMPYSYDELVTKVNDAYVAYASGTEYLQDFRSNVKRVALSDPMTYTHIAGVYAFFTGESNVNINYPDFLIPYTVAHEMTHQRGIAREDEANFIAFLVCSASDDMYIRYSGYINVLTEVMSALYKADKDMYSKFRKTYYPAAVAGEMSSYSAFFEKYSESTASKVASSVNNTYLTSQKVTAGVRSYGLVTDLTVAYYRAYIQEAS